jgi:hypothetical protein
VTRLPPFPVLQPAPSAPVPATPSPAAGAVEPQYFPPPKKDTKTLSSRRSLAHPARLAKSSALISQKTAPAEGYRTIHRRHAGLRLPALAASYRSPSGDPRFGAAASVTIGARGLYVKDHPAQRCSTTDRIVLGIDNALPLVTTLVSNTCLVRSTNTSGQVVTAAGVTSRILGWAFATLFVGSDASHSGGCRGRRRVPAHSPLLVLPAICAHTAVDVRGVGAVLQVLTTDRCEGCCEAHVTS